MKKKIIVLALAFIILPFEGQASFAEDKGNSSSVEYNLQEDFRLPGAPTGGFRGDYRFRIRGSRGKAKSGARKKAYNRRARYAKKSQVQKNRRYKRAVRRY